MYQLGKILVTSVVTLFLIGCGPSKLEKLHIDLYLDQPTGEEANERLSSTLVSLIEPYACGDVGYRIMVRIIRIDLPEKSNVDTIEVPRSREDELRLNNCLGLDAYTYSNLKNGYLTEKEKLTMGTLLTTKSPKSTNVQGPALDSTRTRLFVSKANRIEGLEVDSIRGIFEREFCSSDRMRKVSVVLLGRQEPPRHDTVHYSPPAEGDTVNVGGITGIYVKKMGSTFSTGNHPVDLVMLDPLPNQYYLVTNTYSQPGSAENNASLGLRQLISHGFVNARILRRGSSFCTILVSSSSIDAIHREASAYRVKFPHSEIISVKDGRAMIH